MFQNPFKYKRILKHFFAASPYRTYKGVTQQAPHSSTAAGN